MKLRLLFAALLIAITSTAQNKQPYQLYTKEGKKATYKKLLQETAEAEVVLFGEQHNNSLVHWLELELAKDLSDKTPLILGTELVERDNQKQLDMYLRGAIGQKAFDTLARLPNNYRTDYKPLVDFAREKHFPFIATNIPRSYASMVYKGGFEALAGISADERNWIAPLPIAYDPNLPGYVKILSMGGGHGGDNLPKAQAIKDATMAWSILQNLQPGTIFVHYNGTYHSDNFDGINWYLKKAKPAIKIVTIATVSQKDLVKLQPENVGLADFIIVVDEDMTKTY